MYDNRPKTGQKRKFTVAYQYPHSNGVESKSAVAWDSVYRVVLCHVPFK